MINTSYHHHNLGQWGEDQAARYLQRQGLKLLTRHYHTRFGEIDLIFRDRETIVFVEVKTREKIFQPSALDAITSSKQKKIIGTALAYLKHRRFEKENIRFDVILIEGDRLEWLRDAFEISPFFTR